MVKFFLKIFFLILPIFLFANFDYFPRLYIIKTKYFDIIYSEKSRETAFYLASFADETYEKLQQTLKSRHKERFKVVVSGDVEEANGYASVTPSYTVIAIYSPLPPLDSTVANSKEFFRMEFLHELTHAISLNMRNGVLEFGSKIFGNWLWGASSMPLSMMEGVTVSFESLEGEGRVNYPLIKQEIQQDIHEKNFRTPTQANGSYDGYLARHNFYHYGGFFSHYLQEKYGMEKYVKLWKTTLESPIAGIGSVFFINSGLWAFASPVDQLRPLATLPPVAIENVFGYPLAFYLVYGRSIDDEWKDFQKYMEFKGELIENTNYLVKKSFLIEYPVIAIDKLYFIDHGDEGIVEIDLKTKKHKYLYLGEGINSISVSKDGKYLLVCRTRYKDRKNEITKIFVRKFDIARRAFTGRKINGIREASFFNEKIIAILVRNHFTDIVLIDEKGNIETLVKGNENTIFGTPLQLNENEVVFLANNNGKMQICKVNINTKEVTAIENNISFIRNISVSDGKILFSYNNGEGFYKLGMIENNTLRLDNRNFSGGVFYPLSYNSQIYYVGKFSTGDNFLIFPYEEKFEKSDVKWSKIKLEEAKTGTYIAKFKENEKTYFGFLDFLPHAWIPYLSFQGEELSRGIDGAGLMLYMVDPHRFNTLRLTGVYNFLQNFANLELDWESSMFPIHFNLGGYDRLTYSDNINIYNIPVEIPYYLRNTGGYIDLWYVINSDSPNKYLRIGEIVSYNQMSMDTNYIIKFLLEHKRVYTSPYEWNFIYSRYMVYSTYIKLAGYSMFHPYKMYDGNRGFELNAFFDYYTSLTNDIGLSTNSYKVEGQLEYYVYYLPVNLKAAGGYSMDKSFKLSENTLFSYNRYLNMIEYKRVNKAYGWYTYGDISLQFPNFEIQQGLTFIPFLFINRFYITSGYRIALLENEYYHTGYVRANLIMPMLGGSDGLSLYKMNIYVEGFYAINSDRFGYTWNIDFLKQFQTE
ncbi:MAG: YncE family protein [Brevinematia bacterium]